MSIMWMDIDVFTICQRCGEKVQFSPHSYVTVHTALREFNDPQKVYELCRMHAGDFRRLAEILYKIKAAPPDTTEEVFYDILKFDGEPFDFDNQEMWDLLCRTEGNEILKARSEYRKFHSVNAELTENKYVANWMEIDRKNTFFIRCPRCRHYATYYSRGDEDSRWK